ncbi:MAG TPA: choice-of-anchor P family protein [Solirubrobacterales bacterium]|nr:choice-of-anchor P family protein [Solirubrobacterales bacterium]
MDSKGKRSLRRRRRVTAATVFGAVIAMVVGVPALASANQVDDLLNKLGVGSGAVGGSGSSGGSTTSSSGGSSGDARAGVPPTYTPPLHGTSPHGQGTDAAVDLTPGSSNPYSSDPSQSGEEVVVGDSRGDQGTSGYSGKVTLAYLFGQPIIQVTSSPGESKDGPLQPLQDGLDQLCDASGNQLCLTLLGMHSSTTSNSSTNSFEAVGAHIAGPDGVNADVLTSNGNISDDGTCQTAHGDSSVAAANVGPLTADALQGSSTSTACNSGSQSVDQSSTVVNLAGTGLPLPAAGCDNGTPNTNFDVLSPLLATVCGASDNSGSQAGSPYGVREALTVFALITGDTSLIKATTAGPESRAAAPASDTPPTTPSGGGAAGAGGKGGSNGESKGADGSGSGAGAGNGSGGAGNGAAAGSATAGDGQLAFTGADLLALGLIGGALILGGLVLTTTVGRRDRQAV